MTLLHELLSTLEDTRQLASKLVQIPLPAVIALHGDLGAGKTTLSQAVGEAWGILDPMPSPTFTLLNEYSTGNKLLVHGDLYRLTDQQEAEDLGVRDYFTRPQTLVLLEWADRFPELFPASTLWIRLDTTPHQRVATVTSHDASLLSHLFPQGVQL
jgi:tRNA threonylcarbamoyladenosine biosynthesis protein TsaE